MRRITFPLALALSGALFIACVDTDEDADEMPPVQEPAGEMAPAPAMNPLAAYAGEWDGTSYLESGDTVHYTMTATDNTTGWMLDLPDRDPMPMRILSSSADSVVAEVGPYESVVREGVMVTVRTVSRLQGERMVGTFRATYQEGDSTTVANGRTEATRGM
jgi:hypothetical protein